MKRLTARFYQTPANNRPVRDWLPRLDESDRQMIMANQDNGPIGETLEEFLTEIGIGDEVYDAAVKRVVSWQFEEARKARALSKKDMAVSMGTSRSQVDRVLDPQNVAVSLDMLARAATALGKRLKIELVDVP